MDIVKEVESVLEEEGYVKIDFILLSIMLNVLLFVFFVDKILSLLGVILVYL